MSVVEKSLHSGPLTWEASCQNARKVGGVIWTRHDSPDLARNTIHIRSSVIVRNLYGKWYIGIYYMVVIVGIR